MKINKYILTLLFLFLTVLKADDLDIDDLLKNIETKTDLSTKTKLANSGVTIVYTRDELTRLQVHNLKDILKVMDPIGYSENAYGIPDPYNASTTVPFMSSSIRIYIDNQEMTSGVFGSGFAIYGNMDIDFVDHIEVYYGNPTYQFSTEPAFLIMKLYSKIAKKDEGSKISLNSGSYGNKGVTFYNSQELDDWSYLVYGSGQDDKSKRYKSGTTTLSRDKEKSHLFASFYKPNHKILVDAIKEKGDGFIGASIDATPIQNDLKYDSLHIGYDGKKDNLSFLFTYDYSMMETNFLDDPALISSNPLNITTSLESKIVSNTYTTGVKYKKRLEKHKIITGLTYRLKQYEYPFLIRNDEEIETGNDLYQSLTTTFIEDQYSLKLNSIITAGVNYTKVKNKDSVQQDDLYMYRLGHTYTTNKWTFKTINSHIETSLEPYLVNSSIYMVDANKKYDKTKQDILMEDILYQINKIRYEAIFSYIVTANQLLPDDYTGLLDTYDKDIIVKSFVGKYKIHYNKNDIFEMIFGATNTSNIPEIDTLEQYDVILKSIITINRYDIFNEIASCVDTQDKEYFYNYSAGVIYHYTPDLAISLKAQNIFDKASETKYSRYTQTLDSSIKRDTPIEASSIDQSVTLRMEYTF